MHECNYCGKKCVTSYNLALHIFAKHLENALPTIPGNYQDERPCVCGKRFPFWQGYAFHHHVKEKGGWDIHRTDVLMGVHDEP